MDSPLTQLETMKRQVNQLNHQKSLERITVSKACEELMKYCIEHQKSDVLVTGDFHGADNPFIESKSCIIF